MESHSSFLWSAAVLLLMLTSCVSVEERLNRQFDALPRIDSSLIYESSSEFSGATGRCKGTFLDRWYGTALDAETVSKLYADSFSEKGWVIWPEEVVEIWSLESNDGLYRAHLDVFADPTGISQEQSSYRLSDSVFHELTQYQTVFLLGMTYMSSSEAKKCYGK
jgi:hypothetical protein